MKRGLRIAALLSLVSTVACSSSAKHLVHGDGDAGAPDTEPEAGASGNAASPGGAPGAPGSGGASNSSGASAGESSTGGDGPTGGASGKFGEIIVQWDGAKVSGTALFQGGGAAAGAAPAL